MASRLTSPSGGSGLGVWARLHCAVRLSRAVLAAASASSQWLILPWTNLLHSLFSAALWSPAVPRSPISPGLASPCEPKPSRPSLEARGSTWLLGHTVWERKSTEYFLLELTFSRNWRSRLLHMRGSHGPCCAKSKQKRGVALALRTRTARTALRSALAPTCSCQHRTSAQWNRRCERLASCWLNSRLGMNRYWKLLP